MLVPQRESFAGIHGSSPQMEILSRPFKNYLCGSVRTHLFSNIHYLPLTVVSASSCSSAVLRLRGPAFVLRTLIAHSAVRLMLKNAPMTGGVQDRCGGNSVLKSWRSAFNARSSKCASGHRLDRERTDNWPANEATSRLDKSMNHISSYVQDNLMEIKYSRDIIKSNGITIKKKSSLLFAIIGSFEDLSGEIVCLLLWWGVNPKFQLLCSTQITSSHTYVKFLKLSNI